ncbi:MAG TPA: preprotein translocase subunit YajC [Thermodesulfobacteriota bacterium]|nr:preprotein translocase subunit YajC [Thermodesulfobacteriota bacterium]
MLNFFTTIALAADEAPAPGGMGQLMSFAPLVILFVIFYFLLIRPQQKKAKEQKEMLSKLEKGDAVVTSGGIHGTITGVAEDAVTVEIAEDVRVKVAKEHVVSKKKK